MCLALVWGVIQKLYTPQNATILKRMVILLWFGIFWDKI